MKSTDYITRKGIYKCKKCFLWLKTKEKYDYHIKKHQTGVPLECLFKDCNKTYVSLILFNNHFNGHISNNDEAVDLDILLSRNSLVNLSEKSLFQLFKIKKPEDSLLQKKKLQITNCLDSLSEEEITEYTMGIIKKNIILKKMLSLNSQIFRKQRFDHFRAKKIYSKPCAPLGKV